MKSEAPLAARMRPRTLDEFVGQEHIIGEGKLLRRAIEADKLFSSIILWGPPGTGKTTLAQVIANSTKSQFETISAILAGKAELGESVKAQATYTSRIIKTSSVISRLPRPKQPRKPCSSMGCDRTLIRRSQWKQAFH